MPIEGLAELEKEFDVAIRDALPREVRAEQRRITIKVLRGVALRTPVLTGHARGNWQVSVGAPVDDVVEADKSLGSVIAKGRAVLDGLQDYDVAYVQNNASYIDVLEKGGFRPRNPGKSQDPREGRKGRVLVRGGFSVKAPRGMLAVTLQEIESEIGA